MRSLSPPDRMQTPIDVFEDVILVLTGFMVAIEAHVDIWRSYAFVRVRTRSKAFEGDPRKGVQTSHENACWTGLDRIGLGWILDGGGWISDRRSRESFVSEPTANERLSFAPICTDLRLLAVICGNNFFAEALVRRSGGYGRPGRGVRQIFVGWAFFIDSQGMRFTAQKPDHMYCIFVNCASGKSTHW